jgi:beta-carotene 3-hydroxylase
MSLLVAVLLIIIAFLFMEFIAWFTHKYVMHGFLWILHKDHHKPDHHRFERNDLFALIFAVPSVVCIIKGSLAGIDSIFLIGIGIALYGMAYFLYHDVLVHNRVFRLNIPNNRYFKAIVRAHLDHHAGKKNYGFLFMVPWEYFREEFNL